MALRSQSLLVPGKHQDMLAPVDDEFLGQGQLPLLGQIDTPARIDHRILQDQRDLLQLTYLVNLYARYLIEQIDERSPAARISLIPHNPAQTNLTVFECQPPQLVRFR